MKLLAWEDRHAERDMFDLAGLATLAAFNADTLAIFKDLCGRPPDPGNYREVPSTTRARWHAQLAHQTLYLPDVDECLKAVAQAIASMV